MGAACRQKSVWFIDNVVHFNLPVLHRLSKVLLFWQHGQSSVPVPEGFSTQDKEAFLLLQALRTLPKD